MELSGRRVDTFWRQEEKFHVYREAGTLAALRFPVQPLVVCGCVNPVTEGARQRALCQKGILQTDR